jgi:TRAP-type mannitol/chloroaromatic compound transport system substrate-binding protein|tara:strand:+ start:29500 stop:30615 length:1116 start_codon:yes stop_codon:yes gene_type:complete
MKKKTNRRKFIEKSLASIAGVSALSSCVNPAEEKVKKSININFNKNYKWKMVTTWSPNMPVLGEGCNMFSGWVKKMSGGRLDIKVYGGGELVPSLECFDAVSNGAVEMGSGASYYWAGKIPAAQFFSSVPFGMNSKQMNSWIISGGGHKLYKEIYDPFGLLPFAGGNTSIQMGGWFNKEINSISDLKGLKMRMPGFGGKVLSKSGGTAVTVAGGEIYTNLERGVIDATEWIGPYHDYLMGFYQVAKYYYYPGWHEPGGVLEMIVNKEKFYQLPSDLQEIIIRGIEALNIWMHCEFDSKNSLYLNKLINEENVKLKKFPKDVLKSFKEKSKEVIDELIEGDPKSKKIFEAYEKFRISFKDWSNVGDRVYYDL